MPNQTERKRLKKKMLERWENEGGSIADDPTIAKESNPSSQREGEGNQASASNDSSRVESISSRKKKRGLTQK